MGAPVLLNRCCVFALDLESMFPAEMLKILLQHNRRLSGHVTDIAKATFMTQLASKEFAITA